ncbi:alpha/beta fold hydrolase [Sphingomonas beigongshangi]|jgi:proline-specific peptidase|uniref:alpha/beta fold hydrolase n=1 Tax=Sphingomonas beigongshangi TaxID=2782540 RepID=UPI001AEE648E|nr:alpha/beta fold hydrolase [Sphingomonas beigongshangi]
MLSIDRRTFFVGAGSAAIFASSRAGAAAPELLVPPADRELRVPVRGGSIFVRVNGDLKAPRKPIIFVHGGPGGACWQLFPAVPLASERGVILYDQLDSGHSDAPGDRANWTIERFASEIDGIRAALDIREFHLLGHSWGGIVAARYAERQPGGLRSLIIQDAPMTADMLTAGLRRHLDLLPPDQRAVALRDMSGKPVSAAEKPLVEAAARALHGKLMYRGAKPRNGVVYMDGTPLDRGDAVGAYMLGEGDGFAFTGALSSLDETARLGDIVAPTLLLCGQNDLIPPVEFRKLLPKFRRAIFTQVADAAHMVQWDQPAAWRAAISTFAGRYDS